MTEKQLFTRVRQIWVSAKCYRWKRSLHITLPGDTMTYDSLLELSALLGTSDINISHESGGPYSEVTPDLRPGAFEIVVTLPASLDLVPAGDT